MIINEEYQLVDVEKLRPHPQNPRVNDLGAIRESIDVNGFYGALVVNKPTGHILAGNHRYKAALEQQIEALPVIYVDVDESTALRIIAADNRTSDLGGYDETALAALLNQLPSLAGTGFSDAEFNAMCSELDPGTIGQGFEEGEPRQANESPTTLQERFCAPPMSVFYTRGGWWQERRRAWMSLGIESEKGRGDNLLRMSNLAALGRSGTSVFDPVLAELVYRWFSGPEMKVLDPFAGGSVRGVVASALGRAYTGVELRSEQVEENREQATRICKGSAPTWICGDSRNIKSLCGPAKYDLLFSCPPYAYLERYSDDPQDISTLSYEDFMEAYRDIIAASCGLLKDNRFACFVVGDVRNSKSKNGAYHSFVADTIEAFTDAGLDFYNEGILVNSVGSWALRVGKIFDASRKWGKVHQNVLVFCKGDARKATKACGTCEYEAVPSFDDEDNAQGSEATEFGEKITAASLAGEV